MTLTDKQLTRILERIEDVADCAQPDINAMALRAIIKELMASRVDLEEINSKLKGAYEDNGSLVDEISDLRDTLNCCTCNDDDDIVLDLRARLTKAEEGLKVARKADYRVESRQKIILNQRIELNRQSDALRKKNKLITELEAKLAEHEARGTIAAAREVRDRLDEQLARFDDHYAFRDKKEFG